jgi:hypothetical protein
VIPDSGPKRRDFESTGKISAVQLLVATAARALNAGFHGISGLTKSISASPLPDSLTESIKDGFPVFIRHVCACLEPSACDRSWRRDLYPVDLSAVVSK